LETESLHAANQASLPMSHLKQKFGEALGIPPESWPFWPRVDIGTALYSPHHLQGIYRLFAATSRIIYAHLAVNIEIILRISQYN
jgi:hypothetical protein